MKKNIFFEYGFHSDVRSRARLIKEIGFDGVFLEWKENKDELERIKNKDASDSTYFEGLVKRYFIHNMHKTVVRIFPASREQVCCGESSRCSNVDMRMKEKMLQKYHAEVDSEDDILNNKEVLINL